MWNNYPKSKSKQVDCTVSFLVRFFLFFLLLLSFVLNFRKSKLNNTRHREMERNGHQNATITNAHTIIEVNTFTC